MFEIKLNEQTSSIAVQQKDVNDQLVIVANGTFIFDRPDLSLLIVIKQLNISLDNIELLRTFISEVMSYTSEYYHARVFLRLPMLDSHSKLNELKRDNQTSTAMSVQINEIFCEEENFDQYDREKYLFITDKGIISNYIDQLVNLITTNACWINNLTRTDIVERIETAERLIMILDKINDVPCGFGRLVLMKEDDQIKERMGYVDDIIVDNNHQRKGFGWIITNYLMSIKHQGINGTLCLACVNEGTGAISAPKLYVKAGFKFVQDNDNQLGLFVSEEFFPHH